MRGKDTYSSLFWMVISVGICYGGYELELGTLHDPGSGFIFFWVGLIMVGLSLSIFIQAITEKAKAAEIKILWAGVQWEKVIYVLIALILYAYAFTSLGFLLSTALLLIFLFKAIEPQRWSVAIVGAVLSAFSAYAVFQLWLGSPLPKGFLGIG